MIWMKTSQMGNIRKRIKQYKTLQVHPYLVLNTHHSCNKIVNDLLTIIKHNIFKKFFQLFLVSELHLVANVIIII